MGGLYGVVSKSNCVEDLFYGTDYHSHLGTRRGGLAARGKDGFIRFIHNIENAQFRSKFETDILRMSGNMGIGCISDMEDQPLLITSHLGSYALVTVGKINNLQGLADDAFRRRGVHFSEMNDGTINPTEMVATLINQGGTFEEGIQKVHESVDGSCTLLILTGNGIYAARDRYGRTPLIIGEKQGSLCASMESCAFPNLGYQFHYELGPGEVVRLTPEGMEPRVPPGRPLRICAFLWIYFGYPASDYEGVNVEAARNCCGAALARNDNVEVDLVAGIPDSGIGHAIGYSNESRKPHCRPFVKYTPTWPRSFMPQNQDVRDLVARMKLIPIRAIIESKRILFCEDSIVRGTQLKDTIRRLFQFGAREVHVRPACPPLLYSCRFLNFSRSRSDMDLAGRKAIYELDKNPSPDLKAYADHRTDSYAAMVEMIGKKLNLTSLKYQTLPDMIDAIGLPKDQVCTYCWDGKG